MPACSPAASLRLTTASDRPAYAFALPAGAITNVAGNTQEAALKDATMLLDDLRSSLKAATSKAGSWARKLQEVAEAHVALAAALDSLAQFEQTYMYVNTTPLQVVGKVGGGVVHRQGMLRAWAWVGRWGHRLFSSCALAWSGSCISCVPNPFAPSS